MQSHFAAERVEFAHEMSFRRAAYRGVARHKGYVFEIYGEYRRLVARAGKGERGFATGVSRSYDYGVVNAFGKFNHTITSSI